MVRDILDIHEWIREHALAYRLDLLEGEERARFEQHRAEFTRCQSLVEALDVDPEMRSLWSPGHIPASAVVRWDGIRDTLPEPQRTWAREHLERCGECRQDLEFVGFPDPYGNRVLHLPIKETKRPLDRYVWLAAGWGVGALTTAAAVLLIVNSKTVQENALRGSIPPSPVDTVYLPSPAGQTAERGPTPIPAGPSRHITFLDRPLVAIALRSVTRSTSADSDIPSVRVDPDLTVLQLKVPPLIGIEGEEPVICELVAPNGTIAVRERLTHRELFGDRVMAVQLDRESLESGVWQLRLEAVRKMEPLDEPERAEYAFRIRRTAG